MLEYGTVVATITNAEVRTPLIPKTVPLSGMVTFTPSAKSLQVQDNGTTITVVPVKVTAVLDEDGNLTSQGTKGVSLIATDSVYSNPTGFTYRVDFSLSYGGRPIPFDGFDISVPTSGVTNLATVAPVAESQGVAITRGEAGVGVSTITLVGTEYIYTMTDGSTIAVPTSGGGSGEAGVGVASVEHTSPSQFAFIYTDGTVSDPLTIPAGLDGSDGKSAYELAVANGFTGSLSDWLASLKGEPGERGLDGLQGTQGLSAYEVAVVNGFVGTEAEWLASLQGADGTGGTGGGTPSNVYVQETEPTTPTTGALWVW